MSNLQMKKIMILNHILLILNKIIRILILNYQIKKNSLNNMQMNKINIFKNNNILRII